MATPGNDPFSGTSTRNLLQHIISPKIVSDGTGGYTVKTDLINIDKSYTDELVIQNKDIPNSDILTFRTSTTSSDIIGTTSTGTPSYITLVGSEVHVDNPDTTTSAILVLESDTNGNGYIQAAQNGDGSESLYLGTATSTSTLQISNSPAVIVNAPAIYVDNPSTTSASQIILQSAINGDGYLRAGNGGSGTEKLYLGSNSTNAVAITSSGNVGIGTSTPTSALHVIGNEMVSGEIDSLTARIGPTATKLFIGYDTGTSSINLESISTNTSKIPIGIQQNTSSTSSTPVFINSSGNIGINNLAPNTKLHVIADGDNYLSKPFGDSAFGNNGQYIIQTELDSSRRLAMGYSYLGPTGAAVDCGVISAMQSSVSQKHLLLNPTGNSGVGFIGIGNINRLAATGPTGPTEPLHVAGNALVNGGRLTNQSILILGPSLGTNNYDSCSVIRSTQNTAVNSGSELSFWTHSATSNLGFPSRAITVDSTQQVGIGTQTPSAPLHVIGNAVVSNQISADTVLVQDSVSGSNKLTVTTDTTTSYITANTNAGGSSNMTLVNNGTYIKNPGNAGNGVIILQTDLSGNGYLRAGNGGTTEKFFIGTQSSTALTIDSSQNIGIGTTTPTTKLQVIGSLSCTGDFTGKSFATFTANNTTAVTVTNTSVTANSVIVLTVKTPTGANAGQAYVSSTTATTGFSIKSGAADTSVYNYMIFN